VNLELQETGDGERARTLAYRLGNALTVRRLYASDNPSLARTLEQLFSEVQGWFRNPDLHELSFCLLEKGLSVAGVPLLSLPDVMERLAEQMRQRGIEIVTVKRGVTPAELETLLGLLNTSVVDLTAVDVEHWLRARGADHLAVKHLELANRTVVRNMRELYAHGKDALGRQMKQAGDKGTVDLSAMADIASSMLDLVLRSDVPVATLLALRGRDDYALNHSMNVSLLASAQASALGLDEKLVRQISIAGLMHDIGKSTLPDSLLQKTTRLSSTELRLMSSHTVEGSRILLRTQGSDGLEAIVAAEHHQPWTQEPHLASQLVAIADAFDGIRSLRPFSDRSSLRMALRFMLKGLRQRLNPWLVQRFCVMCGMYLPGDIVELTSGERARVVAIHPELGSRPTIEVLETGLGTAPPGSVGDLSAAHLQHISIKNEPTLAFHDLTTEDLDSLG
jgi:putative nucleotidyltransferase with HDIG domain